MNKIVSLRTPVLYRIEAFSGIALFHSSGPCQAGSIWRKSQKLPANYTTMGPLTDGIDYTFLDGRHTPAGSRQLMKAKKHFDLAQKIMQYTNEMDYAVSRQERLKRQAEEGKQRILIRKLKPKGYPVGEKE